MTSLGRINKTFTTQYNNIWELDVPQSDDTGCTGHNAYVRNLHSQTCILEMLPFSPSSLGYWGTYWLPGLEICYVIAQVNLFILCDAKLEISLSYMSLMPMRFCMAILKDDFPAIDLEDLGHLRNSINPSWSIMITFLNGRTRTWTFIKASLKRIYK